MTHVFYRPVLILNFGAQYAELISRCVREANLLPEIVPYTITLDEIKFKNPEAIILSGGPSSVYVKNAPRLDPEIFNLNIPMLGICYGFQAMAQALGGTVRLTSTSEYGRTKINILGGKLYASLPPKQEVWMSHSDMVTNAPKGFKVTASSLGSPVASFENTSRCLAGVQYHPEVSHSPYGKQIIIQFLRELANIKTIWSFNNIIEQLVDYLCDQIGDGLAICGLSGGIDSAVAAALTQLAIGNRLTCVFIDHGLLRSNEAKQVKFDFVSATGAKLLTIDASSAFLKALSGITNPEIKRKIIGREFIYAFENVVYGDLKGLNIEYLVQGTLYPDIAESGNGSGTAKIKSHHNVSGIPKNINFKLVEPLRLLFKDEVRNIGRALGIPDTIVNRQPFPGPGLGVRILGEITTERLSILRQADKIVNEVFNTTGLDRQIWQCPVILLADFNSVGIQGDKRTYGHPVVLRPVSSENAMTADWTRVPYEILEKISTRITNEIASVNRVVLDITSKPPGTIEWE